MNLIILHHSFINLLQLLGISEFSDQIDAFEVFQNDNDTTKNF